MTSFFVAISMMQPGLSLAYSLYYSFLLFFIMTGLCGFVSFITMASINIIDPYSSRVLNRQRFSRLMCTAMLFSPVFIISLLIERIIPGPAIPVLSIVLYLGLLVFAVLSMWNISPAKSFAAVLPSVILLAIIYFSGEPYGFHNMGKESEQLVSAVSEVIKPADIGLLGTSKAGIDKDLAEDKAYTASIVTKISEFLDKSDPDSRIVPWAQLFKASLMGLSGNKSKAVEAYEKALSFAQEQPRILDNAMCSLRILEGPDKNIQRPVNDGRAKFRPYAAALRLPLRIFSCSVDIERLVLVRKFIEQAEITSLGAGIGGIISNYKGSRFADDICFWAASRYKREDMMLEALKYFKMAEMVSDHRPRKINTSENSLVYQLEKNIGIDQILFETDRSHSARIEIADITVSLGKDEKAREILTGALKKCGKHSARADIIFRLAQLDETAGDFEKALKRYDIIMKKFPHSYLKGIAELKSGIIYRNIDNHDMLNTYSSAWALWQKGQKKEALRKYGTLVKRYSKTEFALELQHSIGDYFRDAQDYSKAIEEYEYGYKTFSDKSRKFDFGWKMVLLLTEELNHNRTAVRWINRMIDDFKLDFVSGTSKLGTYDLIWKKADIYEDRLKYFEKAQEIYDTVASTDKNKANIACALYKSALIDASHYRKYSSAVAKFRRLIGELKVSPWDSMAEEEMSRIYEQGLKLLEGR
jgi:tetratricopeptide (TPR) repeat protein